MLNAASLTRDKVIMFGKNGNFNFYTVIYIYKVVTTGNSAKKK